MHSPADYLNGFIIAVASLYSILVIEIITTLVIAYHKTYHEES